MLCAAKPQIDREILAVGLAKITTTNNLLDNDVMFGPA